MALHPNVVSISDMMTRLRGLPPMEKPDIASLRKCGWEIGRTGVGNPRTYATYSARMANGNRLEATVTSDGNFYIDMHNDGPSYNVAKGQDEARHSVGAAIICVSMLDNLRAGCPVAPPHQRHMTTPATTEA